MGGVDRVATVLESLRDGRPVVVDAATDDDLRVLALALIRTERAGANLLYRVGPSFVRARAGLEARVALVVDEVREIVRRNAREGDTASAYGLVVVGSHVAQTTRQLERLRATGDIASHQLDVQALLDPDLRDEAIAAAVEAVASLLSSTDVVLRRVDTSCGASIR